MEVLKKLFPMKALLKVLIAYDLLCTIELLEKTLILQEIRMMSIVKPMTLLSFIR